MEKNRYFIKLAFNGKNYHGWQVQPNAETIQGMMNHAMRLILREDVNLVGAGRTDTGVHAREFFAHFETKQPLGDTNELDHLAFKLNNFLPKDIAVYRIFPVGPKVHARFDATARTYKYYISRIKNPFRYDTSYYFYGELNMERMNEAARILFSYQDFSSFSKTNTQNDNNLCDLYHALWEEDDDMFVFTIRANRFLRNMVRSIVGTLLDIGQGKLEVLELHRIIQQQNRSSAGFSAPARGLFLHKIAYPDELFY
ncbi:MAG: tRNA pseudouridine(38-40) synthase TruA [Bacteroidales bacterium]|nr:tRNA pseudouridine(38-40) synthase TruA [Bacteroidales bacterium]